MIKRYASLRYDASSGPSEIDAIARAFSSDDAVVASLTVAGGRAYATLELRPAFDLARARGALGAIVPDASLDEPALVVLDVRTETSGDAARVREALGGAGRPAGAVTRDNGERSTIVELNETITPLWLVVDTIDVELAGRPRRIVPLVKIHDDAIARFAAKRIGEPELDGSRMIETHLPEPDFQE